MSRTGVHTSGGHGAPALPETPTAPATSILAADSVLHQATEPSADTLSRQATDRSAEMPFPLYGTADALRMSLQREMGGHAAASAREVSAETVFGTQSEVALPAPRISTQAQSLTDNAVFQGFVLTLAAAYALLLYFNRSNMGTLLSRVSRDATSGKRLFEDASGSSFMRFLNTTTAIGMLLSGVLVVKYGDALMPGALLGALPHSAVLALSLLATAACAGMILGQWAVLRIAGEIVVAQPFMTQLQLLRRIYFSLAVIVISPTLLLFALCPRGTGEVWFFLIVIELTVTVFLYLRETLNLFLSKKISILHWFLYLCSVELFPISFLWLIATR